MKTKIGVSNRHVHLTKETYEQLFEKSELEVRNELNQKGEFASTDTVDLEYNGRVIEHVRIVGPFRNHNQIELLRRDLVFLGIDAPTRRSGDLENTPNIIIKNGDKTIATDGVIRAERHVHMSTEMAEELNIKDRDEVVVSNSNVSFGAKIKVSDNGYFEVHIDKDEAEEYGLTNNDEVEITLCGK